MNVLSLTKQRKYTEISEEQFYKQKIKIHIFTKIILMVSIFRKMPINKIFLYNTHRFKYILSSNIAKTYTKSYQTYGIFIAPIQIFIFISWTNTRVIFNMFILFRALWHFLLFHVKHDDVWWKYYVMLTKSSSLLVLNHQK